MTAADVQAPTLQARLRDALELARRELGFERSRALAVRFALDLVQLVVDSQEDLAVPEVLAAQRAAEACLAAGFTRSALEAAQHAALPLLSGPASVRALYPALDVGHPDGAALAALRLSIDCGLGSSRRP